MRKMPHALILVCCILFWAGCDQAAAAENRPAQWGQAVQSSSLDNFYKVSPELYRSQYPSKKDIPAIKAQEISSIINLRSSNDRSDVFRSGGFTTHWYKMKAGSVSRNDLIAVLKLIKESPKPVLVHCWHGSDRTGFIVAGYRIVRQGWSKEDAIAEMRKGGYGYHETIYRNIIDELNRLDVDAVKKEVDPEGLWLGSGFETKQGRQE